MTAAPESHDALKSEFLRDLAWRNQLAQVTDLAALDQHLSTGNPKDRKAYVGFDPTADSLTIGNLVGIMTLARFHKAGHTPVAIMGGGTGLIGDPSGKTAERQLRTKEEIAHNVDNIRTIFDRVWATIGIPGNAKPTLINNIDWLGKISYLDALRDIGKHFSVNMMMQKDSVKERLHNRDQGISYTEFSYMILQAYDFARLYEDEGVSLQMGGSDQYGNIVVGTDLIGRFGYELLADISVELHRIESLDSNCPEYKERLEKVRALKKKYDTAGGRVLPTDEEAKQLVQSQSDIAKPNNISDEVWKALKNMGPMFVQARGNWKSFGLTWPLVTKSDGTKFGKTESGAIWLTAKRDASDTSPSRTSAYAYYQFWLNAADADVLRFIKTYTFVDRTTFAEIEHSLKTNPSERYAQRYLAREATRILHGTSKMGQAESAAKALFSGEIAHLAHDLLDEVFASVPTSTHAKAILEGEGQPILDMLVTTQLAASKREAKEFLTAGSVTINGRKANPDDRLKTTDLLHGKTIALRRGKKNWHVTRWQ
ncbi:MAG: tyrosine--tRNA ligase [Phycisphaerales bacterium]